jgi:hypothetical protein
VNDGFSNYHYQLEGSSCASALLSPTKTNQRGVVGSELSVILIKDPDVKLNV